MLARELRRTIEVNEATEKESKRQWHTLCAWPIDLRLSRAGKRENRQKPRMRLEFEAESRVRKDKT
jgi:hypothetical protein